MIVLMNSMIPVCDQLRPAHLSAALFAPECSSEARWQSFQRRIAAQDT